MCAVFLKFSPTYCPGVVLIVYCPFFNITSSLKLLLYELVTKSSSSLTGLFYYFFSKRTIVCYSSLDSGIQMTKSRLFSVHDLSSSVTIQRAWAVHSISLGAAVATIRNILTLCSFPLICHLTLNIYCR